MAGPTGIEWTEVTWNPVTGCDRVSPGCDNCYALALANRLKAMGNRSSTSPPTKRYGWPGRTTGEWATLQPKIGAHPDTL